MRPITCQIPDSLYAALQRRMNADNETCDHIVAEALSQNLDTPIHTLFQVSTSAALVEGIYQGAVRVSRLLDHGDFGLGTFVDLDGEMAVLDGVCCQISASGAVAPVDGDRLVPYAVVTRFSAAFRARHREIPDVATLVATCDQLRDSNNIFYAFRVRGMFHTVKTRAMKPVLPPHSAFLDTTFTSSPRIDKRAGTYSSAAPRLSISRAAPSTKCKYRCRRLKNFFRRISRAIRWKICWTRNAARTEEGRSEAHDFTISKTRCSSSG